MSVAVSDRTLRCTPLLVPLTMARSARKKKGRPESVEGLLEQALRHVNAGHGKQALDLLRRAQFKGAPEDRTGPLLYRASLIRAGELEARGFQQEAAALCESAKKYESSFESVQLSAAQLLPWLRGLEDEASFEAYAEYLADSDPHTEAEIHLADRLVLRRCGDALAKLAADNPFRRDGATMLAALDSMDAGDWQSARETLRPISRTSAFRDWRVFCAAMDAHARSDWNEVGTSLDRLRDDFPLADTVKALRLMAQGSQAALRSATGPAADLLGATRARLRYLGLALRNAIKGEEPDRIAKALSDFARAADPLNPAEMRFELHCALTIACDDESLDELDEIEVATHLLRPGEDRLMAARRAVQELASKPIEYVQADSVADYLRQMYREFPDPDVRTIARGRVLERLALALRQLRFSDLLTEDEDGLAEILEVESIDHLVTRDPFGAFGFLWGSDLRGVSAELLRASIRENPSQRRAHQHLIELTESSFGAKLSEQVSAREDYANAFPEDPEPWIGLAELRLRTNAYRKAEAALAQAAKFAGDDERILDLRAVSALAAAQANLRKERLPLAGRDLAEAESRASSTLMPVVLAWKVLLNLASRPDRDLPAAFAEVLESRSAAVRLTALALCLDACAENAPPFAAKPSAYESLHGLLDGAVAAAVRESPTELLSVVRRLPDAYDCLAMPLVVPIELHEHWSEILRAMSGSQFFEAACMALVADGAAAVRHEALGRLRRTKSVQQRRILLLCLAAARYLLGEDDDSRRFRSFQESIPADELQPVRTAAGQLGKALEQPFPTTLSSALRSFKFEILDEGPGLFG